MDVIFEGSLCKSWGMKDILQAVVGAPNVQNAVLRVSCPDKNIQGRILVADGKHITGAACNVAGSGTDAYEALRTLLDLTEGNFVFLDLAFHSLAECETTLFICLERILKTMPQLPPSSTDLFDQNGLLNKVFGQESFTPPLPPPEPTGRLAFSVPPVPVPRSRSAKAWQSHPAKIPMAAPITQWNIVEPLFQNPQATHTDHLDCCPSEDRNLIQAPDEQRSSMVRLRAMPDSKKDILGRVVKNPQPIRWLLSALGLS